MTGSAKVWGDDTEDFDRGTFRRMFACSSTTRRVVGASQSKQAPMVRVACAIGKHPRVGATPVGKKPSRRHSGCLPRRCVKKLAYRAGVPRIASGVDDKVREHAQKFLKDVVELAVLVAQQCGRKTMMLTDVLYVLSNKYHRALYGEPEEGGAPRDVEEESVKKKKNLKAAAVRKIKEQQMSTATLLAMAPFVRMVRAIVKEVYDPFRVEAKVFEALRELTQASIIIFLEDSFKCALHAGRYTVRAKDTELAGSIRGGLLPNA